MTRHSFWQALRATRRDHWTDALVSTLFAQVGGLAPVWIGFLFVLAYGGPAGILQFAKGGEFALYSAAVLSPTIYLIVNDRPTAPFAARPLYMLVALVAILLSVAGYTLVAPASIGVIPFAGLRTSFVARATVGLFLISVIFSFVVLTLDNARTRPPVVEMVRTQERDLDREFDELGGA